MAKPLGNGLGRGHCPASKALVLLVLELGQLSRAGHSDKGISSVLVLVFPKAWVLFRQSGIFLLGLYLVLAP